MNALTRRTHPLRSRSEAVLRNIVVLALIAFFIAFFFAPILMAFLGSFHLWNPLKGQYQWNGLANWTMALTSELFWRSMGNTLWFSAAAVAARVVIGLLLASALHSKLVKWKSLFRTLYYLPTITPMVAVAFVRKFMYQPQFGSSTSFWAQRSTGSATRARHERDRCAHDLEGLRLRGW
jgi:multiple sugar transport system permease protein